MAYLQDSSLLCQNISFSKDSQNVTLINLRLIHVSAKMIKMGTLDMFQAYFVEHSILAFV